MHRLALCIDAGWSTARLEAVNFHLPRRVLIPAWLRPQRLSVAAIAICLPAEEFITAFRRVWIEIDVWTWLHPWQCKLVKMQRCQFTGYLVTVGICRDVAESSLCGNRELLGIVEALVKECWPEEECSQPCVRGNDDSSRWLANVKRMSNEASICVRGAFEPFGSVTRNLKRAGRSLHGGAFI